MLAHAAFRQLCRKGGPAKRMNHSSSAMVATYTIKLTIRSRAVTPTRALMFCSASARTLRSEGERQKRC